MGRRDSSGTRVLWQSVGQELRGTDVTIMHANGVRRVRLDAVSYQRLDTAALVVGVGTFMVRRGPSVQQTNHRVMCEVLRGVLREALDPGGGDGLPVGSVPCRAVATLYMLLLNHPVDRRGRCRSCRRPGAVLGGRWRRCRMHGEAALWLTQPAGFLAAHLTREVGPAGGVEDPFPLLRGGFPRAGRADSSLLRTGVAT